MLVGLGNPGPSYGTTRHNAGFWVLDRVAKELHLTPRRRGNCLVASGRYQNRPVLLIWPQTFMNLSGEAVGPLARYYRLTVQDVVVAHDDLDLPPGRLRVRPGGGDGGHRGVRSLIQHLGSRDFLRVKVGVGRPPAGVASPDYVLSPPCSSGAKAGLEQAVAQAAQAMLELVVEEPEIVMNRFNGLTGGSPEQG